MTTCAAIKPLKVSKKATIEEFAIEGAVFKPDSLTLPQGIGEHEWVQVLQKIQRVSEASLFWLADALLAGCDQFGHNVCVDLGVQATGYTASYICELIRVARKFPPERRLAEVSFSRYAQLAALPPAKADELLHECQELSLSSKQLTERIHEERRFQTTAPWVEESGMRRVEVYLSPETYEYAKRVAGEMRISEFIQRVIEDYVRIGMEE